MQTSDFQRNILNWYYTRGRTTLPWRKNITAYRVWISEIMLQQTQVATVIPYYTRFMTRFPRIKNLAQAPEDEVMQHWSGLGYYARARNLHRTAKIISQQRAGRFPRSLSGLVTLPGIGRSTAGAIISIAMKKKAAILDGNVKRILSRLYAIPGASNQSKTQKILWAHAEHLTPTHAVDDYSQAIMDLGATLCTPKNPNCDICPVAKGCCALQKNQVALFPHKKPKKVLTKKTKVFLIVQNKKNDVLVKKNPGQGIWGGAMVTS